MGSSSISTITFNAFTPKARQLAQQRGQLEDFICLQNNVAMLSEPVHGLLNAIYEFVHKMQSTLIHSILNGKEQLSVDERKETLSFISRFFSPKFGEQTKDGKRAGMAISQNNFIKLIPILTCYDNDNEKKKSTDARALITLAQQFGLHKGVVIPLNFYHFFSQVASSAAPKVRTMNLRLLPRLRLALFALHGVDAPGATMTWSKSFDLLASARESGDNNNNSNSTKKQKKTKTNKEEDKATVLLIEILSNQTQVELKNGVVAVPNEYKHISAWKALGKKPLSCHQAFREAIVAILLDCKNHSINKKEYETLLRLFLSTTPSKIVDRHFNSVGQGLLSYACHRLFAQLIDQDWHLAIGAGLHHHDGFESKFKKLIRKFAEEVEEEEEVEEVEEEEVVEEVEEEEEEEEE